MSEGAYSKKHAAISSYMGKDGYPVKVLISGYACEPNVGSEPGAGWAWVRAAAVNHRVWLLTRGNNIQAIERSLQREDECIRSNLTLVPLDLPSSLRFWKRGSRGVRAYYLLWQLAAWHRGRELHGRIRFDVAHHLTFAIDSLPAGVAWIKALPVVWGPVGGTAAVPWRLWRWLGTSGSLQELVREAFSRPARRLFGDATARRSAVVVAQNNDVAARFGYHACVVVEPNVALEDLGEQPASLGYPASRARVALFVGRLIPLKGLRMAIAALARPEAADWTLDVYGSGPDDRRAVQLACRLGVADRVRFMGRRPRDEVLSGLQRADALVFPSFHDAAGWAVAEAVAVGTPVVSFDRGGPPVIMGAFGVSVTPQGDAVGAIAAALQSLPPRGRGTRRWGAGRLPALVDSLYGAATLRPTVVE